jgi:hypothetical protein
MARKPLTDKLKDTVKKEFNYKCAICAVDNPQIHHIDEDHANNEIDNLLPLCPNCHLTDQHNPTRKVDIPKLQLFRTYKDPTILKSQFHPLYLRTLFLNNIEENDEAVNAIFEQANCLIEFVKSLEMGGFYSKELEKLIKQNSHPYVRSLESGHDYRYEQAKRANNLADRKKLIDNSSKAIDLIIELLRYQNW